MGVFLDYGMIWDSQDYRAQHGSGKNGKICVSITSPVCEMPHRKTSFVTRLRIIEPCPAVRAS